MTTQIKPITTNITFTQSIVRWIDLIFCLALFSLAIIVGVIATQSGPGLTPDSASYISTAANLSQGNGFVSDVSGPFDITNTSPFTMWPPSYPIVISFLMLFKISPINSARFASIISFGLVLCSIYWLGLLINGRRLALITGVTVLFFMPILRAASFALSEMLFTLFSILAIASFVKFWISNKNKFLLWLILSGILIALAILTRYVGMIWVIAGLPLVFVKIFSLQKSNSTFQRIVKASLFSLLFSIISIAPILPWMIRNQKLTGQLTGLDRVSGYHTTISQGFKALITTIISEILPSIHFGLRSLLKNSSLLILAILVILVVLSLLTFIVITQRKKLENLRNQDPLSEPQQLSSNKLIGLWLIPALFAAVYLAGLIILSATQLFPQYDWPRYLLVIYPLLFLLWINFWIIGIDTFFPRLGVTSRWIALIIPALLWMIPYGIQGAGFVSNAAQGQELSSSVWRNNQGIQYLSTLVNKNDLIFSDRPQAIILLLNRPAKLLPYEADIDQFSEYINTLGLNQNIQKFIIVFKGDLGQPDPYLPPRISAQNISLLLSRRPEIHLIADFNDSAIYQIGQ